VTLALQVALKQRGLLIVTTQLILAEITDRIVREFRPVRIVLFGSRARGSARPDSDFDLLVVLRECNDKGQAKRDIYDALEDIKVNKDIVVTTPDEIARSGNLIGTVLRPALQEGVVLYDCGTQEIRVDINEEEIAQATRNWMSQALENLRVAESGMQGVRPGINTACYLAQQSIEKAIKAVLVFLQIEFPFTHEIEPLLKLVPEGWNVKVLPISPKALNDWATAGHYLVADLPGPVEENAWEALRQARMVLESVTRDLAAHGLDLQAS